jgi:hypothetical protein
VPPPLLHRDEGDSCVQRQVDVLDEGCDVLHGPSPFGAKA